MNNDVGEGASGAGLDDVANFSHEIFCSLPRSDQRRWAEVYVRGLLSCPGRKSVRNIAHTILRLPVAQSLQQFVNQSPWDWRPVRARLANWVADVLRPSVQVIAPVAIPKSGTRSVGVSRQFLPALGRTINCQVGLGLFLASRDAGIPVNWRLRLSGRWDEDELLRKRAHIPTEEVSQPVWRYALDMLDEARDEWEMPNVPVVMDVTRTDGNALATALQNRGMPFMLKVDEAFEVRGIQQPRGMAAEPVLPVGHFVNAFTYRPTRPRNPRLLTVPVGLRQRPRPEGEPLHLLATVPESPNRSAYWITNGPLRQLARVTPLTRVDERVRHDLRTLESTFGLRDFEGRSFHGWHHHMTLVSAAYAFAQCG